MLTHPTLDKLIALKLTGMAKALREQMALPDLTRLPFEDRLGLLVDREMTERENRKMTALLRVAKLGQQAAMEDLDLKAERNLSVQVVAQLGSTQWLDSGLNVLITGPTGVGKSYLGCALAHKACREGYSTLYLRVPRLFRELHQAKLDGSYARRFLQLSRAKLIVLDDFGLAPLDDEGRRDLLELLEERCSRRSTVITSQLPVASWHEAIGQATLADAILDRLVHNAYRIELSGESMRRMKGRAALAATSGKKP